MHNRVRDKAHLKFVAGLPCTVCGTDHAVSPHHMMHAEPSAMGLRSGDQFTVPLCHTDHMALHRHGDERAWWETKGINPFYWADRIWRVSCQQRGINPDLQENRHVHGTRNR